MDFKPIQQAISELHRRPRDLASRDFKDMRRLVYGRVISGLMQDSRSGSYRHGADALRILEYGLPYVARSKAQLFQDLWALYELGGKRDGYFVEFGAASGVELSNTWMLEKDFGWTGILAEPNPEFHASLKANRDCILAFECVYTSTGDTVPFRQHKTGELSGIDLEPDAIERGHKLIHVPTITLGDLLEKHGAPRTIDYLSIDTEGSELEILQTFDLAQWEVRLISVEHNFGPNREPIARLLKTFGYKRAYGELSQFDDWYVLRR